MALTDIHDFITKLDTAKTFSVSRQVPSTAGFMGTVWAAGAGSGAVPTTAVVCDATTTGAMIPEIEVMPNANYLAQFMNFFQGTTTVSWLLMDRLVHNGGLDGTVSGNITTNLPTPALTRYTDGIGVMIGIHIYTSIGTTAQELSVAYVNENNVTKVSKNIPFGGTGNAALSSFRVVPLDDGDMGVKQILSVNVSGSTDTAGNYGVVLFKPLWQTAGLGSEYRVNSSQPDFTIFGTGMNFVKIEENACLTGMIGANLTGLQILTTFKLIET